MPETPVQGLADEDILVERAEHLGDCRTSDVPGDAEGGQLAFGAKSTVSLDQGLSPRAGHGRSRVVDRTFPSETCHRRVDVVRLELAAGESRAYLSLRELAPGEPS